MKPSGLWDVPIGGGGRGRSCAGRGDNWCSADFCFSLSTKLTAVCRLSRRAKALSAVRWSMLSRNRSLADQLGPGTAPPSVRAFAGHGVGRKLSYSAAEGATAVVLLALEPAEPPSSHGAWVRYLSLESRGKNLPCEYHPPISLWRQWSGGRRNGYFSMPMCMRELHQK